MFTSADTFILNPWNRLRLKSAGARSGERGGHLITKPGFTSKHFTIITKWWGTMSYKTNQLPVSKLWPNSKNPPKKSFQHRVRRIHCSTFFPSGINYLWITLKLCLNVIIALILDFWTQNFFGCGDDTDLHFMRCCLVSGPYCKKTHYPYPVTTYW